MRVDVANLKVGIMMAGIAVIAMGVSAHQNNPTSFWKFVIGAGLTITILAIVSLLVPVGSDSLPRRIMRLRRAIRSFRRGYRMPTLPPITALAKANRLEYNNQTNRRIQVTQQHGLAMRVRLAELFRDDLVAINAEFKQRNLEFPPLETAIAALGDDRLDGKTVAIAIDLYLGDAASFLKRHPR